MSERREIHVIYCLLSIQVNDLKNELTSANNQITVLTHSLSDRQAQLDMEKNNNKVGSSQTHPVLLVNV